jgi:hypothetical protein
MPGVMLFIVPFGYRMTVHYPRESGSWNITGGPPGEMTWCTVLEFDLLRSLACPLNPGSQMRNHESPREHA